MTNEVGQAAIVAEARRSIERLAVEQHDAIARAGLLVADCVQHDGVVHAFGTGHSQAVAMEIAGRAGGLIPTNRLTLHDGVWFGGDPIAGVDRYAERDPQAGRRTYELASFQAADILVVASNSGINGAVVELARLAVDDGHSLIVLTSLAHTGSVPSRHPSGRKLHELADVVIDNGAPVGDAILELPTGGLACAISSVTSALAAQMMVAEALAILLRRGISPPVYLSANVAGADAHNRALESRFSGRIRRRGG